jgi:hypothetical protein
MKFKTIIISIYLLTFLYSCSKKIDPNELNNGFYFSKVNTSNYNNKREILFNQNSKEDNFQTIKLILAKSDFEVNNNFKIAFYLDDYLVFYGDFSNEIPLKIPKNKINKTVHPRIEILDVDKLYIFENKNSFVWKSEYNFLFFVISNNKEVEKQIFFFPQNEYMID